LLSLAARHTLGRVPQRFPRKPLERLSALLRSLHSWPPCAQSTALRHWIMI